MDLNQVWQSTLGEMELQISRVNFATWLKKSLPVDKQEGILKIALPNNFAKEWVESKYLKNILEALRNFDPSVKKVEFTVASNLFEKTSAQKNSENKISESQMRLELPRIDQETNLNPRYTFGSFVVGSSNELAYSAAMAIVKEIGTKYNPFFIYGGVGLGKTHLIQAMGNEIKNNFKNQVKVKYVSAERFTSDIVSAIRNKRMEDIKKYYRNVDVLIIDDIQFIGGKEKTEEEFFHAFNALYELNKQIIISSDRPPQSLPILEERLRSRFEGGMVADISFPEYEMRVAIIKNRLLEYGRELDEETIDLIARKVKKNIRELEGVLKKIIFYQESKKAEFTKEKIDELIEKTMQSGFPKVTFNQVLKGISVFFEIPVENLIGKSRKKEYVEPRQILMYLLREMLGMSYPTIAEKLGKDHTTIIHGYNKIYKEINKNSPVSQKILLLRELINKN